jgi:hypothetical protein
LSGDSECLSDLMEKGAPAGGRNGAGLDEGEKRETLDVGSLQIVYVLNVALPFRMSPVFPVSRGNVRSVEPLWPASS